MEIWHKSELTGPEGFAVYNNELYTTVHGGDVVKLTGNHITPVVKFGKPCKGIYQEKSAEDHSVWILPKTVLCT